MKTHFSLKIELQLKPGIICHTIYSINSQQLLHSQCEQNTFKMGNNVSSTKEVLTAADVSDYIRRNPGIFLDLSGELEEHENKRRRVNGMTKSDLWKTS